MHHDDDFDPDFGCRLQPPPAGPDNANFRLEIASNTGYSGLTEGQCTPEVYGDVMAVLHGKRPSLKWVEANIPFGPIYDDIEDVDSIHERGLNRPGVLLEVEEDVYHGGGLPMTKQLVIKLIGHINAANDGCGCCSGIDSRDIVKRYAIVWEEQK